MADLVSEEVESFFRGRRVLITGDTGFKGSWLALWLHLLGANVAGYALPPDYENGHYVATGLDRLIAHTDGDVRDLPDLLSTCLRFEPDVLFHLAARSLVRQSYLEPKATFDTNVGGATNILEVVRQTPSIRSLVFVTSDKCYRNKGWLWGYRENDELGGDDPYCASKAAAELVFHAYSESYFRDRETLGAASVRAGNVIGGGDWSADRLLPDAIRSLIRGKPVELRNPDATRPWQHVLDPLYGYLRLVVALWRDPKGFSGAWNFGPSSGDARTVREVAQRAVDAWGGGEVAARTDTQLLSEAAWLALNCDKAQQVLGWRPRWDFAKSVDETVRWYRAVQNGQDARTVSTQQIADYTELSCDP